MHAYPRFPLVAALVVMGVTPWGSAAQEGEPGLARPSWAVRADSLLTHGRPEAAYAVLAPLLDGGAPDSEVQWRAARAAYERGILAVDPRSRTDWYRMGVAHARLALAASPDERNVLRWAVAVVGSLADDPSVGPRETARLAEEAWGLIQRTLALYPDEALAHSAAGSLHAKIMKLSRVERFIARVVLGGEALKNASWGAALDHHHRAVSLDPANALYRLELAKCLAWRGARDDALAELDTALALPHRTPVDDAYRALATEWRARLAS